MRTRLIVCAVIATLGASMPVAVADEATPDRRAHDLFATWNFYDDYYGHNHFYLELERLGDAPEGYDHTGFITAVEVTTMSVLEDGSIRERRFAASVARATYEEDDEAYIGRGGFTEGPCVPCGPYNLLFFALPHDFGGAPTTVDIRLFLPQAEGDCAASPTGPCGGSVVGYHNGGAILFGVHSPESMDQGDAIPSVMPLH